VTAYPVSAVGGRMEPLESLRLIDVARRFSMVRVAVLLLDADSNVLERFR
jgi:hypothetical protein